MEELCCLLKLLQMHCFRNRKDLYQHFLQYFKKILNIFYFFVLGLSPHLQAQIPCCFQNLLTWVSKGMKSLLLAQLHQVYWRKKISQMYHYWKGSCHFLNTYENKIAPYFVLEERLLELLFISSRIFDRPSVELEELGLIVRELSPEKEH